MKKLISILLVAVMLVVALASCSSKKPAATTAATTTKPTTTAPPVTTTKPTINVEGEVHPKWETLATDVKAMDAARRSLKFELSDVPAGNFDTKNKEYMAGPDSPNGASTIDRLVYERNQEASDLLGITIEYDHSNREAWSVARINIARVCNTADLEGAPDMIVNMMYDMVGASLASSFRDLETIEDSYFDFTEEGWFP